jgi:hypothetical protein
MDSISISKHSVAFGGIPAVASTAYVNVLFSWYLQNFAPPPFPPTAYTCTNSAVGTGSRNHTWKVRYRTWKREREKRRLRERGNCRHTRTEVERAEGKQNWQARKNICSAPQAEKPCTPYAASGGTVIIATCHAKTHASTRAFNSTGDDVYTRLRTSPFKGRHIENVRALNVYFW